MTHYLSSLPRPQLSRSSSLVTCYLFLCCLAVFTFLECSPQAVQAQANNPATEIKIPPLPLRGADALIAKLDPKALPKDLQKSGSLLVEKKFEAAEKALPPPFDGRTRPELAIQRALILALAEFGQQHFAEALKAAQFALSIRGSDSDVLYLKALAQLHLNKPVEAVSSLEEAMWFERFKQVTAEELYYTLAAAYSRSSTDTSEKDSAPKSSGTQTKNEALSKKIESALNTSVARNAAFAPARIQLAKLYQIQANRVVAVKVLKDGVAADPENKDLKLALADALITNVDRVMNKDDIAQALKTTSDLFQSTKPEDASYKSIVPVHIRALLAAGKPAEAEKALGKALKSAPEEVAFVALKRQVAIEKQAETNQAKPAAAPVS